MIFDNSRDLVFEFVSLFSTKEAACTPIRGHISNVEGREEDVDATREDQGGQKERALLHLGDQYVMR